MHNDWGAILTAIGTVLGSWSVIYNTFCNHKKDTFSQTISELRSEIEQKQKDAEIYREKWLNAEKGNDELRRKINRLEAQVDKLKRKDEKDHEI